MKKSRRALSLFCALLLFSCCAPVGWAADDGETYLQEAVAALGSYYRLSPAFDRDNNLCDMLEQDLAEAGYPGIETGIASVEIRQDGGGIASNGDIAYFFADPDGFRGYWGAVAAVEFTLEYQAAQIRFAPGYPVNIPWDGNKVLAYMQQESGDYLTFEAIRGGNAGPEEITENLILPQYCNNNRNVKITWTSDDETALTVEKPMGSVDQVLYGDCTGVVRRGKTAKTVRLTAVLTFNRAEITLTKTFTLNVPPQESSSEETEMQAILAGYTGEQIQCGITGLPITAGAVTGDLLLPTPAELGIYDRRYDVLLSVENPADVAYINVPDLKNAGRVYIFRPLPEEGNRCVSFTVTLQSRQNPDLSLKKQFPVTVKALDRAELDEAKADMQAVKNNFFSFIKGNNTNPDAVCEDLQSFYGIYRENGVLTPKSYVNRGAGGIVAVVLNPAQTVPDYREYFSSSHPLVVAGESLLVTRPREDTTVTVSACLTDERYGAYLEDGGYPLKYAYDYPGKYQADSQLTALYRQPVTAVFTVKAAPKEADISVSVCKAEGAAVSGETLMAQVSVHTVDADGDGTLTVHDVMTALHEAYCQGGYAEDGQDGPGMLWGETGGVLYRNHALVHTAMQPVLDGDYIEVCLLEGREDARYLHFQADKAVAQRGMPMQFSLTDGRGAAVSGAEIGYFSPAGEFIPFESIVTDAEGRASIVLDTAGTVYLTARAEDSIWPVCMVEAVDTVLPAETLTVSPSSAVLKPGGQLRLTAELYPTDATNRILSWESSNQNVAVVNPNGILTAVGAGTTVVTAANGEVSAGCLVTVEPDGGSGGGMEQNFSVTFTLEAGDAVWIAPEKVSGLAAGTSVFDVFKQVLKENGFSYTAKGGYVSAVTNARGVTLANFDYGANSGWMYTVDGVISPVNMAAHQLFGGEKIVFFYAGDYTEFDKGSGGGLSGGEKQEASAKEELKQPGENTNPEPEADGFPFTDVSESDWYYPAVKYIYKEKLFAGVTETEFCPAQTMSRAMLVTVLHRMAGMPKAGGDMPFADVDQESWYGSAAAWAAECGIAQGISPAEFAPDAPVSREQAAVILYRYAGWSGADTASRDGLEGFPDAGLVSSWAGDGVRWMTGRGILQGRDDGGLDPAGHISRAEAAQMLYRYLQA